MAGKFPLPWSGERVPEVGFPFLVFPSALLVVVVPAKAPFGPIRVAYRKIKIAFQRRVGNGAHANEPAACSPIVFPRLLCP